MKIKTLIILAVILPMIISFSFVGCGQKSVESGSKPFLELIAYDSDSNVSKYRDLQNGNVVYIYKSGYAGGISVK
jgi:uncharacterized lipoprotein YehR (DUF1307 family)